MRLTVLLINNVAPTKMMPRVRTPDATEIIRKVVSARCRVFPEVMEYTTSFKSEGECNSGTERQVLPVGYRKSNILRLAV